IQLQKYPNLSRDLARANSVELLSGIDTFAVGGYDYIYSLIPIILFLAYFFLNYQISNIKKVGILFTLIFLLLLIPESAYATATLLSILFLMFLVINNYTSRIILPFILIFISIIIMWLFYSGGLSDIL